MWKALFLLPLLFVQPFTQRHGFERILFVGNSLTASPPSSPHSWPGYHGMAASQPDRDYVHRVQLLLAAQQGFIPEIAIVAGDVDRWDSVTGETIFGNTTAQEFEADLVIVQMGDNGRLDTPYTHWEAAYQQIAEWTPGARRIALGLWSQANDIRGEHLRQAATEAGMVYIRINDLRNRETVAIDHPHSGVGWHPNDAGMAAIAERVVGALHAYMHLPVVFGATIPPTDNK